MHKTIDFTAVRNKGQKRKTNLHIKHSLGHILLDYVSSKAFSGSILQTRFLPS